MSNLTTSVLGDFRTNNFRTNDSAYDGGRSWELPIEVLPFYPSEEYIEEPPPDGGTLAWLHVLIGFFVIMNVQGLNQASKRPRSLKLTPNPSTSLMASSKPTTKPSSSHAKAPL
ncbi:hypothetical protein N7G274_002380 [Stereocaulon virgatum]|uniref:Uncharacterized protein n=1 Tax=Stereocaulon virgatum TaxID=373712 RepID=A0ABR4AHP6_9LECA